ncbi:DUF3352 domain-containing protein [Novipirellula artificiosorum]|uniref:DUF3352 domain-containing protein n=1 Tax=Novipirellula artificiosorum TaxID=2528016 RepID=A0A5C6DLZ9_9BACT|nr:DUF3352 domain-containing protein [Novipirellula artificiosorum]TWU37164.1 hypothetical protein Poly41_32910 [Novipirellula artificiosorum]
MFRVALLIASATFLLTSRPTAAETPAVTQWVSPDAWIVAEISRPDVLVDRAFRDDVVQAVTSLSAYQDAMADPDAQQAIFLLNYFKGRFECDFATLLKKAAGGNITLALGPNDSNLLVVEGEDAKLINEIHEFFLSHARDDAKALGQGDPVKSAIYQGVTGWSLAPNEMHAIIDNRLLVSNKPEVLKAAIDRRANSSLPCFADSESYKKAKAAASVDAVATVYANMEVLKQVPDLKRALSENENPLATLLLAPLQRSLREASWLIITAEVNGDAIQLEMTTDGSVGYPAAVDGFALPQQADDGAMPNFVVPGQIAGISLYRDLYRYYAAKDELFPERTSGIIFFENMMGIFFTGRDLTEEVLAETQPQLCVVVAEQRYAENVGTPLLQLPGFAVVLKMRDRDRFAPIIEEAWQKAIGLVNFTRGQQAEPGLIIDKPQHADVIYTTAAFSVFGDHDRSNVDSRFNFQPTLAMPGDYLILSSSDSLTQDLIDQIAERSDMKPVPSSHSLVVLSGPQLAAILNANFDAMVRNNMVEDGNTREQAEQQQKVLIAILQHLRNVSIDASTKEGKSHAVLKIEFALDSEPMTPHTSERSQQGDQ